jgi:hypothetical protein
MVTGLDEEWKVEFEIGHDEDGKPKAENVTALGGGPCTGPRRTRTALRSRRRRQHQPQQGTNTNNNATAAVAGKDDTTAGTGATSTNGTATTTTTTSTMKRQPQPMWHDILKGETKQELQNKNIRTSTGTIDISYDKCRIKLGTRNYASLANEDKILAEGSFTCIEDGTVTLEWKRAIQFTDVWNPFLDLKVLPNEINLNDETVTAVGAGETMYTLMGEETTDPRSTLTASGFEMRRVVLTTKRR